MPSTSTVLTLLLHCNNSSYSWLKSINEINKNMSINCESYYLHSLTHIIHQRKSSEMVVKYYCLPQQFLTHWGRVTHICIGKLTIIGSDNGLSPDRRQAIIWTNAGILLNRTLGTNFSDFLGEIRAFSFKKMHLKMPSGKLRPSCLGLNVLNVPCIIKEALHAVP